MPAQRAAFRVNFMRVSADARETFAARARPGGSFPYEHCTAGLASGASCAMLTDYCLDVIAGGLRASTTTLAERTQYNLATDRACPASRDALVTRLRRCEPVAPDDRCEMGPCVACEAGHLAALTVLGPTADDPERAAEFQAMIDATPEPVARSIAENLGAPDAPADIESTIVQRGLRAYCFSLVARSEAPAPFACNAVMVRFLTHPEFAQSPKAWEALGQARARVREAVLGALLTELARGEAMPLPVLGQLRTLPVDGTTSAIAQALQSPVMTESVRATLREFLVQAGAPLTPPTTPTAPRAPTNDVPAGAPAGASRAG